jgi:hypothetical protein
MTEDYVCPEAFAPAMAPASDLHAYQDHLDRSDREKGDAQQQEREARSRMTETLILLRLHSPHLFEPRAGKIIILAKHRKARSEGGTVS